MSRQSESNKREKSMAENIVIITMIGVFMAVFIYYFFKQEKEITKVGFDTAASTFATRVMAIRAQWFMENQPSAVNIKKEAVTVQVNKKGWVDYDPLPDNCIQIWQVVMQSDLLFAQQPVAVIALTKEAPAARQNCRYQLASGEYFDYVMQTGVVTKVSRVN